MVLGLIATDSVCETVHGMNFRKQHDIRDIDFTDIPHIIKQIETQPCFTHILVELEATPGKSDNLIQLLLRLRKTTTIEYIVLLEGYPSDSRLVQELLALGIKKENLIFSASLALKYRLTNIFYSSFSPVQPLEETPTFSIETHCNTDEISPLQVEATPSPVSLHSALPPSKITTATAYAELQSRMLSIQKENLKTATLIAIAGAGQRIGTTTQALQILMYLRSQNKSVALVEMHNHPCLKSYADVYSDAFVCKTHCVISGNTIYFSPESLPTIQKEYEYLVLDFGNFHCCKKTDLLQADIKIISCGIKPWETESVSHTFRDNDGTFLYLFSFVPQSDEKEIIKQMEEYGQRTFFAPYSPDMFQYNSCDDLYGQLLANINQIL